MKKSGLTQSERDADKKKLLEEMEVIEETGQESESKGIKAIKQVEGSKAVKEKQKEERLLYELDSTKKQQHSYKEKLLYFLHNMISEIEFPMNYQWGVWYDGKGVRLSITDHKGKRHQRAFIPNHDPKYDLNACYMFALWTEDIIDKNQSELYIPPAIWTPNKMN